MRVVLAPLLAVLLLGGAAPAGAATPGSGAVLANGAAVDGRCSVVSGVDSEAHSWVVFTVDPARKHGGANGGVALIPSTLPRLEEVVPDSQTFYAPSAQGIAVGNSSGGCDVADSGGDPDGSTAAGSSVVLNHPGPYVFEQFDAVAHWVVVADTDSDPTTTKCAANDDEYYPGVNPDPPPALPAGSHWAADSYCNTTTLTRFSVKGATGSCPVTANMSQWPAVPYINQYDAGARLGLPKGFGLAGGNACGPSSLLMALLRVQQADTGQASPTLPGLTDVFDATMSKSRAVVNDNESNWFVGNPNAIAYLKSTGYKQARTEALETNVASAAKLFTALATGPAVVSTAFGNGRWGVTGGGHMIMVSGLSPSGLSFVVQDPAGNFFSSPTGHYAPGKCGYDVLYPVNWIWAYTTKRWFLQIGPRTPPPAAAASLARASSTPTPALGSAIAIRDANPGAADAPQSFYLQDPQGRRVGWIDGAQVEEIPNAAVAQEPAGWTDPSSGDPDVDPSPTVDPPPRPRSIVAPDVKAGTSLHVVSAPGASFALAADAWRDGAIAASDQLSGSGTGQDAVVASPALESIVIGASPSPSTPSGSPAGGTAPAPAASALPPAEGRLTAAKASVRRRSVSVRLTCAGGKCRALATLTSRQGRRTVTVARGTATLGAGEARTLKLKPTSAGRRLLARRRRVATVLNVVQPKSGRPASVVRRQKLRL